MELMCGAQASVSGYPLPSTQVLEIFKQTESAQIPALSTLKGKTWLQSQKHRNDIQHQITGAALVRTSRD